MTAADLLTDAGLLLRQHGVAVAIIDLVISELRYRYGGDEHYIHRIERQRRNEAIAADLANGLPPEVVAKRQKCSSNTVRRVRNEWQL